jgi:N-acetyl-beta-hexosaminidase
MRFNIALLVLSLIITGNASGTVIPEYNFPVRGLCINAPRPGELKAFIDFIENELAPRKINTLILQVEYNYSFTTHPELADSDALSENDAKVIVEACRKHSISIIPQINLLGHQSWASKVGNLLRVYPEFDETPWVKMPENYKWPNDDKLYCKSYCPLHPGVHEIVFDLVDELCAAFESEAFHAGMDEVFYIGEDKCPRCSGKDKSELFAGEVTLIRNHLNEKKRKLWIWGDRLLDGNTSGLGEWEASINDTHRAIDFIPKDVVICDWHYERAEPTAVYFAMKGFDVVTCPWKNSEAAVVQAEDMERWRANSSPEMAKRFLGMVQTVWSGTGQFIGGFNNPASEKDKITPGNCFRRLFPR